MYWLTGFLGLVSLLAPFAFGYTDNGGALWTSLIIGVLLVGDSILEGLAEGKQRWEYIAAVVLGIVAVIAPFILGFTTVTAALWTSIVVGIIAVIAAGGTLTSGQLK